MKKITAVLSAALAVAIGSGVCFGFQARSAHAVKTYANYMSVNASEDGLVIEPTAILEPASFAEISGGANSVILTPSADMKVTLGGETRSFESVFDNTLKAKYIPVVRLTSATVDGFIDWMTNTYTVSDMMAISSELSVIQKLYADEVCQIVNTVYDLTDKEIGSDRYWAWQYLGDANAAGCNILMLDASDENMPVAAEYISAMSKVCWGYAEDKIEGVSAVTAGCYGIVSPSAGVLKNTLDVFTEDGFARAQYIAAHRGITTYCNEQSLTSVAASVNEGATHIELDVQITKDRDILICHNSESNGTGSKNGYYFVSTLAEHMRRLQLVDYSNKYDDTYPTLREVFDLVRGTDVILILELKFDNGSTAASEQLNAVEKLKEITDEYPDMAGHWFTITFFAPYAEGMKTYLPKVPVGHLGGAQAGAEKDKNLPAWGGKWCGMGTMAPKIAFTRSYNMVFDETYQNATNTTALSYLARGYVQNTWTFDDLRHFDARANIATTNKAEDCALLAKEISTEAITLTAEEYAKGTVEAKFTTYNGWVKSGECKIIEVAREGNTVTALLHYTQPYVLGGADRTYGLYSKPVTITIA